MPDPDPLTTRLDEAATEFQKATRERDRLVNEFLADLALLLKTGTIEQIRELHAAFLRDEEGPK